MPLTTDDAPVSSTEDRLRGRLAAVLDQAKTCLLSYGVLDPGTGVVDDQASAATLLNVLGTLLAEALQLNGALRDVDELSTDGALVCGAVTVAVSALSDTIAVLHASLDVAASA